LNARYRINLDQSEMSSSRSRYDVGWVYDLARLPYVQLVMSCPTISEPNRDEKYPITTINDPMGKKPQLQTAATPSRVFFTRSMSKPACSSLALSK
jgi:hypothetical protein